MSYAFMVDSAGDPQALWDRVVQAVGKPYAWVGYLGDGGSGVIPLTADRVKFLTGNGVRILPTYNNAVESDLTNGYPGGVASGQKAVTAARALGMQSCLLACDIEQRWSVVGWWFAGWARTVLAGGFTPAIYCSFSDLARFRAAMRDKDPATDSILWWVADWLQDGGNYSANNLPVNRYVNDPTVFAWQFAGKALDGAVDLSIVSTEAKLWFSGADPWAEDAWLQATAAGVFDGYDPKEPLTREEFAVILVERRQQLLKLLRLGSG